jgi:hypothetical protein
MRRKMRCSARGSVKERLRAAGWIVAALCLVVSAAALAADQIGVAVTVRNDVTGKIQSEVVKLGSGSDVFGKEIVKTNADSSAKIVLKDNTNLNVGPSSSVTLDNFVFNGPSDYKQASMNLAKGVFRFTTGASDKRAYDFKTSAATIGVRGTDCVVVVKDNKSHVECTEGESVVCPRKNASKKEVVLDEDKKKRCKVEEADKEKSCKVGETDKERKCCSCSRDCAIVEAGQAVDVSDEYVCASDFTGQTVGGEPMSYAEATAPISPEGAIMGGAILGGIIGGVVGGQPPVPPPVNPPPVCPPRGCPVSGR